jgi:predicted pyridoxine 5'-phosphate oxidase superfamily flavin-nucleotide-binding protein
VAKHFSVITSINTSGTSHRMIIPDELKKVFEKVALVLFEATDKEISQNVVPIFLKKILNDESILLIGDFTEMSKRNLIENNNVCISFWDPETETGYQITGIGTYHMDGLIYEVGRRFIQSKRAESAPKGVVKVKITKICILRPGPCYYRR